MLVLKFSRESTDTLYQQLINQISTMIESGTLRDGDILPSSRALAKQHQISRTTVCRAYDELIAQGLAISQQGGYTTVRKTSFAHQLYQTVTDEASPGAGADSIPRYPVTYDFKTLTPDPALIPVASIRKAYNTAIHRYGPDLFGYGECQGFRSFRQVIARQMSQYGIHASFNDITITNGALHATALVFRLLIQPGSEVIVEQPTYTSVLPLLKQSAAKIIPVSMTRDGMDLSELESIMETRKPVLVFTMPNFQNPTGITTTAAHREQLYLLCRKYNVPIVEDGFEEELKYFDCAVPPIKALDRDGIVFYIGTFSKTLAPGLRTGWLITPTQYSEPLLQLKRCTEPCGNLATQAALSVFCEQGDYLHHLKKLHREYRKRMKAALRFIPERLSGTVQLVFQPKGGYLLWFRILHPEISEQELTTMLAKAGVAIMPGGMFFTGQPDATYMRLSIALLNAEQIQHGLERIGQVLNQLPQHREGPEYSHHVFTE